MSFPDFLLAFGRWMTDHGDTHQAFLAEVDRQPVGMAWLVRVERVPGPGVWTRLAGTVQSAYVLPEHRDRGLGAALVGALLDEAAARGFDYVSVHPSQRSFPFYRRLGFRDSGRVLEIDLRSPPPG
jgi:GNAT superfamily N-acetyltransferase